MDAQAKKALFRAKLKEQAQKTRIDSPLVRYNEIDQPVCRVCDVVLKSESLWPAHQASKKHHEAINNLKANASRQNSASNVKPAPVKELPKSKPDGLSHDATPELSPEFHKSKESSALPANFFDKPGLKTEKAGSGTPKSMSFGSSVKAGPSAIHVNQGAETLGLGLQGSYYMEEQLSKHRTLMNIFDKAPIVDKDAFVAPGASVIGDVQLGAKSSIWYGCVLRGDVNSISVGAGTNIQDNSLVHVAKSNLSGKVLPTIIGDNVTVGHSAVIHGCTIEDEAFVGMGAILLDGVVVEKHAMVAAGALVRQDTRIPAGEVWGGNPAKFFRKLSDEEIAFISQSAANYTNLAQVHAAENAKPSDEIEFEKALRKKFAKKDEDYDSMIGIVRETPPELILPDNILPKQASNTLQK